MAAIVARFDQELLPAGFMRRKTTWNRRFDQLVEVLDIQRSKAGGDVTMNVGVLERGVYAALWGRDPDPFVEEPHCIARARIGQLLDTRDRWWETEDPTAADEMVLCLNQRALPFLKRMHSLEEMRDWLASAKPKYPLTSICYAVLQWRLGNASEACLILADLQAKSQGAWKARAQEVSARILCL
jgi:hypothetical protein